MQHSWEGTDLWVCGVYTTLSADEPVNQLQSKKIVRNSTHGQSGICLTVSSLEQLLCLFSRQVLSFRTIKLHWLCGWKDVLSLGQSITAHVMQQISMAIAHLMVRLSKSTG